MPPGEEPRVEDVISEIAGLLAAAFDRRARIRLIQLGAGQIPSTEGLDNTGEPSVHGMTLTCRREESRRS